jgi:hypothetical protein
MGMIDYLNKAPSRAALLRGDLPAWIKNSKRGPYIAQVMMSAPPWVRKKDFNALRAEARWLSVMHGKEMVLDHIVPLRHPRVCGLTVPWNLRIIPWDTNLTKGNNWCPEQVEMLEADASTLCMSGLSQARTSRKTMTPVGSGRDALSAGATQGLLFGSTA